MYNFVVVYKESTTLVRFLDLWQPPFVPSSVDGSHLSKVLLFARFRTWRVSAFFLESQGSFELQILFCKQTRRLEIITSRFDARCRVEAAPHLRLAPPSRTATMVTDILFFYQEICFLNHDLTSQD